ncbi:ZIP family metal transporter [Thermoleophilum album]|uniref:ZIP family metal transporter n=1 Tax=Thermoleophilum album TaxID=29539 RepID=UPI00237C7395|nr:ZIP family metal transporter [Thermoleophilum album]WDT93553.1 ZIP family metal transporter [Thermoleophilum album]
MSTLLLAACATTLATGLGALPVFYLGKRAERFAPALWAVSAGAMAVAAVAGLIVPAADEGSPPEWIGGAAAGVAFLFVARRRLRLAARSRPHAVEEVAAARRASLLVFLTLLIHSLPEGFALGTAYASGSVELGVLVFAAIALQNVPEGTTVALPLAAAGAGRGRQFWAATASSLPQPPGAAIAYLAVEQVQALLPLSLAFAGGAMAALVVVEMTPRAFVRGLDPLAVAGFALGASVMLALTAVLGV